MADRERAESARTMPRAGDDRLVARLQSLPHGSLVETLVACMIEGRSAAEACIAKHQPLPEWAVSGVLQSESLLPCVFASLDLEDTAAAVVCSSWRQAWRETEDERRGLRAAELLKPAFDMDVKSPEGQHVIGDFMVGHPSGRWLAMPLIFGAPPHTKIVDASMDVLHTINFHASDPMMVRCVTNDLIYCTRGRDVQSFNVNSFAQVAHGDVDAEGIANMSYAGGHLFCATMSADIVVLDAWTLAQQRRFGAAVFAGGEGSLRLAVVGEEVYVAGSSQARMHVFSFAGEHLRDITGDWREVDTVLHHNGRLYVVEYTGGAEEPVANEPDVDEADEDTWPEAKLRAGRRILVLTPRGDTLQVWTPPKKQTADYTSVISMAILGRKLIVAVEHASYSYENEDQDALDQGTFQPAGPLIEEVSRELVALKGI